MRKYTEARKQGNKKWDAANLDRLSIALPKGYREDLKTIADRNGLSVNGYIRSLIEKDNPGVFNISEAEPDSANIQVDGHFCGGSENNESEQGKSGDS